MISWWFQQTTMPNPTYIDNQIEFTWTMHGILTDWLGNIHSHLGLMPETLFLAVNIFNHILSVHTVSLAKLQLVGITSLFIMSKVEETVLPPITHYLISPPCLTPRSKCSRQNNTYSRLLIGTWVTPTPPIFCEGLARPASTMSRLGLLLSTSLRFHAWSGDSFLHHLHSWLAPLSGSHASLSIMQPGYVFHRLLAILITYHLFDCTDTLLVTSHVVCWVWVDSYCKYHDKLYPEAHQAQIILQEICGQEIPQGVSLFHFSLNF